ncbi:MAG TPA: hypothetical protein VEY95_14310 [Azospirillaceae bacterium]|nr:hypothetical protein [Azospirillaceae bacterium]
MPADMLDRIRQYVDAAGNDDVDVLTGNDGYIQYRQEYIAKSSEIMNLASDPYLVSIAQQYFGVQPVLGYCHAWKINPVKFTQEEYSYTAQMFHNDKDGFHQLKIFLFLSDVPSGGEHYYVPGTHRVRLPQFWTIRRFTDEEVESAYGADRIRSIPFKAGHMVAADTRALHKGSSPTSEPRIMLQFTYMTSLFSIDTARCPSPPHPGLIALGPRFGARYIVE